MQQSHAIIKIYLEKLRCDRFDSMGGGEQKWGNENVERFTASIGIGRCHPGTFSSLPWLVYRPANVRSSTSSAVLASIRRLMSSVNTAPGAKCQTPAAQVTGKE